MEPGDWQTWLLRGGIPAGSANRFQKPIEACGSPLTYQSHLERDLRQLSAVSSLPDFQRVMILAAQRNRQAL